MPAEPFQVDFYLAGGAIVRFTLSEETLTQHPHPAIRATATRGGREGLAAAAAFWLEATFDRKKASDATSIIDDEGAWWLIAPAAVLAIRLFDPTAATPPRRVGFVASGSELN
jgi:hypothetical protein